MPKVDIIVPAFNAAKYLPAAIESVARQTFDDWRILLVDDGSTDNTAEIVAPFAARLGAKLKYIKQPNGGLPAARNTAIRHSSAELLALLDADDVWLPHRLAETVQCFEDRPHVGLSHGMVERIDHAGNVIPAASPRQKYVAGRIAPYIYMRKVDLVCPTLTFRRKCIDETGPFDESLRATEDRDLWLRIALRYEVAFVPRIIAQYRISSGSMSTDPDRMFTAQMRFIEKHYGSPGCGRQARRIALSSIYRQRAEAFELRRQSGAAAANSLRALWFYPFDQSNLRTAGSLLLRWAGSGR